MYEDRKTGGEDTGTDAETNSFRSITCNVFITQTPQEHTYTGFYSEKTLLSSSRIRLLMKSPSLRAKLGLVKWFLSEEPVIHLR